MAIYVLVHGGRASGDTWNRLTNRQDYPPGELLGGESWRLVTAGLQAHGHHALAPTLADETTHGLSSHVAQVCSIIGEQKNEKVVLVGHSYGGMVITGAAAAMPERIGLLVYLDADYPDPGQSLFDILKSGGFSPEEVVGGSPMAYTEKLIYEPMKLRPLAKAYILCTGSKFIAVTKKAAEKALAEKAGWRYLELPSGHFAQAEMPTQLTDMLLNLAR